jgi:hypothetical protein
MVEAMAQWIALGVMFAIICVAAYEVVNFFYWLIDKFKK